MNYLFLNIGDYLKMEDILKETKECLNCKTKPCQKGCPLENRTTDFINFVKDGKYHEAFEVLAQTSVLPAICGRICPQDRQCQGKCVKNFKGEAVKIGKIEQFIGDYALEQGYRYSVPKDSLNKMVAVVGSGPAGLTCAAFLRKKGYQVTIYEKNEQLGGLLRYGIPNFRLDKSIVDKVIAMVLDMGIEVKTKITLGVDISLEELRNKYDAIFLGIGANVSKKMMIPGEEYVLTANELLEKENHPNYKDKKVIVVGGGNVAMDIARTVKRLGAKDVVVIYHRDEDDMKASKEEVEKAKKEGVKFLFRTNVIEARKREVECVKVDKVFEGQEDRKIIKNVLGSNFVIKTDYVVLAIGSKPNKEITRNLGVEISECGYILVDEQKVTSFPGVFAAGDITDDIRTVAWASRGGRDAAYAIMEYLS